MSQNTTNGSIGIKLEDQQPPSLNQQFQSIDWDSERQLVSSLAKLQELESKIHELRSLLPDRLLAPINPIVNPRRPSANSLPSSHPIPRNPQALSAALRKSAIEGVAEINSFKELWNSTEMQNIWHKVDEKLAETKGAFPQEGATGMWRVEYADLLDEIDQKDQKEKEKGGNVQMEVDNDDPPAAAAAVVGIYGTKEDTDPKPIIQSFQNRAIPGFRVTSTRNESTIIVSLGLAGLTFEIQEALTTDTTSSETTSNSPNKTSFPEWRVESRQQLHGRSRGAGTSTSRLETAIVAQLNSRARKWDLRYLLELILSYGDIRTHPCKTCGKLTDSVAQLPVLRKPVPPATTTEGGAGNEGVVWEGYHVGCI